MMTDGRVDLEFACPSCGRPVGVTVHYAGELPDDGAVGVPVPCPHCRQTSQLSFDADGTVLSAVGLRSPFIVPEPSLN